MPFRLVLGLYRLLLPLFLFTALPGWLIRMGRRGGFGSGLRERFAIYTRPEEEEPCGAVMVHSISVGETMLALKLIRAWLERDPEQRFVLATGTATGHAVAMEAALPAVRVTYSPVDLRICVSRYLKRFEPSQLVLVEGEAWPHLLMACRKRGIPVSLLNARLSPRSERRYRKLASIVRPVFGMLDKVAAQEDADIARWEALGVARERITVTGSSKFDPGAAALPQQRADFSAMLSVFGAGRPVILAASTHGDEEAWLAEALREVDAVYAVVPRHAERRAEVRAALEKEYFEVVLRSAFYPPLNPVRACLVIDSTGELRDWTAHSTLVVIGKSILGTGGQNPAEAILARKPLLFGKNMQNFEPLASSLVAAGGAIRFSDQTGLAESARILLADPARCSRMCDEAARVLAVHAGATGRMLDLLTA
ncbi:glycosyltransferase N-terminal domain-containing protein [Haloferula sp. BvORR071]|uniref:3-deoxy-D-manno-octulosonic acid transferase n=1 Tax=Haloferula sp. BvORR071 TaxID=1396141 RepID=UPI0006986819|nr:glycosyltransferase N-terminal domain-containing protein [Haloferula sp. BvORR071]